MGCIKVKKSDFNLLYDDNTVFINSQWKCLPTLVFVLYRVILALYFIGWCLYSMISSIIGSGGKYFTYLTNWGFMTITAYLVTASSTTIYFHANKKFKGQKDGSKNRHTPWYFMLSWLLYNISAIVAPVVTLIYWAALYQGYGIEVHDFHVHAVNFIAMALEVAVSAMPVRYVHVIYPLIYGICYMTFTLIYWGITGNVVYAILDYSDNPGLATASIFGCFFLILIFQLLLWAVFKLKLKLSTSERNTVSDVAVTVETDTWEDSSGKSGFENPLMTTATQCDMEDENMNATKQQRL
ncbi:protein rolling stone-like [Ptychodera flava]|uniref:protein rolling stone-like n=1 Tax=Ptychodera flava TaxID=63121 RepID=UPI003969DFA5